MARILIEVEVEIAEVILIAARLTPDQQTIGDAQLADIERPAAGGRVGIAAAGRNRGVLRLLRRAFRRGAHHGVAQHDLANAELVRQQRPEIDVETHIFRRDQRLRRAGGGQAHTSGQNAELRPDVPAQIAAHLQPITTALLDLFHHVGSKIVWIDQQHQRGHACNDDHQ